MNTKIELAMRVFPMQDFILYNLKKKTHFQSIKSAVRISVHIAQKPRFEVSDLTVLNSLLAYRN